MHRVAAKISTNSAKARQSITHAKPRRHTVVSSISTPTHQANTPSLLQRKDSAASQNATPKFEYTVLSPFPLGNGGADVITAHLDGLIRFCAQIIETNSKRIVGVKLIDTRRVLYNGLLSKAHKAVVSCNDVMFKVAFVDAVLIPPTNVYEKSTFVLHPPEQEFYFCRRGWFGSYRANNDVVAVLQLADVLVALDNSAIKEIFSNSEQSEIAMSAPSGSAPSGSASSGLSSTTAIQPQSRLQSRPPARPPARSQSRPPARTQSRPPARLQPRPSARPQRYHHNNGRPRPRYLHRGMRRKVVFVRR